MEDRPTINAASSSESKLSDELIRIQIQNFVKSFQLVQHQEKKNTKMLDQEKNKLEMMLATLRAYNDGVKKLESQVREFIDLLRSHGRTEGLEEKIARLEGSINNFQNKDEFGKRRNVALEAFEEMLAEMSHLCGAE